MARLIVVLILIPNIVYAQNVDVYTDEFSSERTVTAAHILPLNIEGYVGEAGFDAACFTARHKCVIRVVGLSRPEATLQGSAQLHGVDNVEVAYIDEVPRTTAEALVFVMPFAEFDRLGPGTYFIINGSRIEINQNHLSLLYEITNEYNAITR